MTSTANAHPTSKPNVKPQQKEQHGKRTGAQAGFLVLAAVITVLTLTGLAFWAGYST